MYICVYIYINTHIYMYTYIYAVTGTLQNVHKQFLRDQELEHAQERNEHLRRAQLLVSSLFLMGTATLYRVCSTGLR